MDNNTQDIMNAFSELTQDIEDVYYKPWLLTAIVSHINHSWVTGVGEQAIRRVLVSHYQDQER